MEARVKTLERENKALHEGYAALLKAMGKVSSAFAQCVETRSRGPRAPVGRAGGSGGGRAGAEVRHVQVRSSTAERAQLSCVPTR